MLLSQFLDSVTCWQQHDIHGTRSAGSSKCVNDWRIGHGLPFARQVEGERVIEGACVSEA